MRTALVALLVTLTVVLSGEAESKPGGGLNKKQCAALCERLLECEGLSLADSSTAAELLICVDDCVFESKLKKKRAGWSCAVGAQGCQALRACEPGAPGRSEAARIHSE